MVACVEPREFQNAKHEQPSAPQKLLRSLTGAVPAQARPWLWPWTLQALAAAARLIELLAVHLAAALIARGGITPEAAHRRRDFELWIGHA